MAKMKESLESSLSMALGARGVSILFASGDSGYQVQQKYPASSPYVTSVGGSTLGAIFRQPYVRPLGVKLF